MAEQEDKKLLDIYVDDNFIVADYHKDWGENEVKEYAKKMKELLDNSQTKLYHLIIVRWVPTDLIVLGVIWKFRDDLKYVLFHKNMERKIYKVSNQIVQIMGENALKLLGLDSQISLIPVNSLEEAKELASKTK